MNTLTPNGQNELKATPEEAGWRRDVAWSTWWVLGVLGLAFFGAMLFHPICFCPVGWYITGAISLVLMALGVGADRRIAGIALALSMVFAGGELNAKRDSKQNAARAMAESYVRYFDEALRAYKNEYGSFPSGTAVEILATMRGKNPRNIVFVDFPTRHINKAGELIDGWETPFRIVQASENEPPRLISAGPDRKFGTEDDVTLDSLATKDRK